MPTYDHEVFYFTGFEVPIPASPATDFDHGYDAAQVNGFTDVVDVQTTVKRHGDYALKVTQDGANTGSFGWANPLAEFIEIAVASCGAYIETPMVSGTMRLLTIEPQAGPVTDAVIHYNVSSGNLEAKVGTGTTVVGPAVSLEEWVQIDARLTVVDDGTDIDRTLEWQVDGVAQTSATESLPGSGGSGDGWILAVDVGPGAGDAGDARACTVYFDDFVIGIDTVTGATEAYTMADEYPYGEVEVVGLSITGVGTHSNPTHFQEDDGTAIDADSWNRLDDFPPTTTDPGAWDGIKQVTANSASYLEFTFEDLVTTYPVLAVRAAAVAHEVGTGSSNLALKGVTGASEDFIIGYGVNRTTGLQTINILSDWGEALRTPTTWDVSKVNALTVRVGYATDVSPEPKLDALMLEVAVVPVADEIGLGSSSGVEVATFTHTLVGR